MIIKGLLGIAAITAFFGVVTLGAIKVSEFDEEVELTKVVKNMEEATRKENFVIPDVIKLLVKYGKVAAIYGAALSAVVVWCFWSKIAHWLNWHFGLGITKITDPCYLY